MSRGFATLDNPSHEGKTNTWLTPLPLIKALGEFDFDPCGFVGHNTAKYLCCQPLDGLKEKWFDRVWLNPPYGKNIGLWLNKLQEHGNGIALVFSRTETRWFQSLKPDLVFFLQGRIKFLNDQKQTVSNAGHGSMLLAYGQQNVTAIKNSILRGIWL